MTIKRTLAVLALAGALASTGCSTIKKSVECPLWGREREVCLQQQRHPSYESNKHRGDFRWTYDGKNSETNYSTSY